MRIFGIQNSQIGNDSLTATEYSYENVSIHFGASKLAASIRSFGGEVCSLKLVPAFIGALSSELGNPSREP